MKILVLLVLLLSLADARSKPRKPCRLFSDKYLCIQMGCGFKRGRCAMPEAPIACYTILTPSACVLPCTWAQGRCGCLQGGCIELQTCSNGCAWRNDGVCDDGGPGALTYLCPLGDDWLVSSVM